MEHRFTLLFWRDQVRPAAVAPPRRRGWRGRAGAVAVALLALQTALTGAQAQATDGAAAERDVVRADPARFNGTVVRIEGRAVQGAASAETLGATRVGSGVIIGERLVLTIGYLLLETEAVEVTVASRAPDSRPRRRLRSRLAASASCAPCCRSTARRSNWATPTACAERQKVLTLGQGERPGDRTAGGVAQAVHRQLGVPARAADLHLSAGQQLERLGAGDRGRQAGGHRFADRRTTRRPTSAAFPATCSCRSTCSSRSWRTWSPTAGAAVRSQPWLGLEHRSRCAAT